MKAKKCMGLWDFVQRESHVLILVFLIVFAHVLVMRAAAKDYYGGSVVTWGQKTSDGLVAALLISLRASGGERRDKPRDADGVVPPPLPKE